MANPEDAGAWYHLADLYFRGNEYERAVEAYQKSVDLKPDKGYAYGKMGVALSRLNRPDEAAAALEQAVALLPNPAVEYNNLGIVYGKLGRHEDEIKALQKAIELRPRYATARLNLGVTYLKIGNINAAKAQHEIVKELDAQTADLLLKEINKHATSSPGTP
jgi:superkiller protein 3